MMRTVTLILAFLSMMCANAFAEGERDFNATAYEYNVNASPQISSRTFKSAISVFERGGIKIIEIKNFIQGKRKPDITVKVIRSSDTVGSLNYNREMEVIGEYPNGEIVNDNLYVFKQVSGNRTVTGLWFIDDDYMMRDFQITGEHDALLYKETIVYRAKHPTRKKKGP